MNNRFTAFIVGILCVVIISFLLKAGVFKHNAQSTNSQNKKLQIVASFYPMYYFASQIGGDKADVMSITPASAEPHDYEPTTQDIAKVENSNMLVLNGGALEAWGDKVKDDLKGKNVLIVTAGGNLANKQLDENGKTIQDPHVWLSPPLAKIEAENIEKGFEQIDSSNKSFYQTNLMSLESNLDSLDKEYASGLASCQKKDIVTSHAAFGYLADRYHLNQVAITGVSPDEEPSSQKLVEITNLVRQKGIKVIFFESLVSPKLSQTIASETGSQTMVLDPIEGITNEDMQKGANYMTVMKQNLMNLETALLCNK